MKLYMIECKIRFGNMNLYSVFANSKEQAIGFLPMGTKDSDILDIEEHTIEAGLTDTTFISS